MSCKQISHSKSKSKHSTIKNSCKHGTQFYKKKTFFYDFEQQVKVSSL